LRCPERIGRGERGANLLSCRLELRERGPRWPPAQDRPLFRAVALMGVFDDRWRRSQLPHDAKPGEHLEEVVARIPLPPEPALIRGVLMVMVIVVPPLAAGDDGKQPVVAAGIGRLVAAPAEDVAERVDGESPVPQ